MINEKENAVLLIAESTPPEINTQKQKFHNLFRVEPWLVPMRKHGEWQGLTDEDCLEALKTIDPETKRLPLGFSMFAAAIQSKLKEKNI